MRKKSYQKNYERIFFGKMIFHKTSHGFLEKILLGKCLYIYIKKSPMRFKKNFMLMWVWKWHGTAKHVCF